MNLFQEYMNLAWRIASTKTIPAVTEIHLPSLEEGSEKNDTFGFVFLEDGSVGPFYTSLNDNLEVLWQLYPEGKSREADTMDLIENLSGGSEAMRAVALGAFNALSQHVMRQANYSPFESAAMAQNNPVEPQPGETIGMVGYFRPLIERLLAKGIKIRVLEKNPGRVEVQPGVELSTNPADLASCGYFLCTASTLINGTLSEILSVQGEDAWLELIGPSGSGLPDLLFQRGVNSVGGIEIIDSDALVDALAKQEPWGRAGKKYQLTVDDYPGITTLLARITP